MSALLAAGAGTAIGGAVVFTATPAAIQVARRTEFYDHPREYRRHNAPTPFLGGAAVLLGFILAALVVGQTAAGFGALLSCAAGLWLLGTIDDRIAVAPKWRLLAEIAAAVALYVAGLGWSVTSEHTGDLALTVIWVAGLVNAFNLMDNLDGACGTVGCASAAGIGTLAALHGQIPLAGMAFALSGACAGFLPRNLAGPAKIFLGDGGSMLIGFLVAALGMATARHLDVGGASLLAAAMLAGLPILDTTLVSVSRMRRGVRLVTGGRDHLTHRLLGRLGSPRRVAGALAVCQAFLCAAAISGERLGTGLLVAFACTAVLLGAAAIAVLDSASWRPKGIAVGAQRTPTGADPVELKAAVSGPDR